MQFRQIARIAVSLTVLGVLSSPLYAHHGNAVYESAKEVTIQGTLAEWLWANPLEEA